MPFTVDLVSPEGSIFSGEADMVVARTPEGDVAFQPGHIPFIGVLVTNRVKVFRTDDSVQTIAVHRGFVEVSVGTVTILSDVAELAEEIDVGRAEAALARAEEALRADPDDANAIAARTRAETRLMVAEASNASR